jgi:hypothetical protein
MMRKILLKTLKFSGFLTFILPDKIEQVSLSLLEKRQECLIKYLTKVKGDRGSGRRGKRILFRKHSFSIHHLFIFPTSSSVKVSFGMDFPMDNRMGKIEEAKKGRGKVFEPTFIEFSTSLMHLPTIYSQKR